MAVELSATLAALADPARRAIVEHLAQRPARPSELAEALELSRPAVSRHLRILRQAELIAQEIGEEDGRARPIALLREPLAQVHDWLDEVEAFWGEQLASFQAYAEKAARKGRKR